MFLDGFGYGNYYRRHSRDYGEVQVNGRHWMVREWLPAHALRAPTTFGEAVLKFLPQGSSDPTHDA